MNLSSALQSDEEILRQERLHPGIFGLPVVLLVLFLLPTIPILFLFKMLGNMVSQLSPGGPSFASANLSLLLISLGLLPALFVFVVVLVAYLNSQITLTNRRLIYRTGFVVRAAGELPLENVDAMFMLEPLLGRLFGYGTVTVSSLGGLQLPFRYLGKPHVFHAVLQRAVANAKGTARAPLNNPQPSALNSPSPHDDSRYMPRPR